jgi:hypothetical protein
MQSNVNLTDENALVLHGDNHNPLSNTHGIRKMMDIENPQGCGDWQTRGSMVRLRGYNQRLNEGCLFTVLDSRRPTCGLDHGVASTTDSKGQMVLKKSVDYIVRDGGGTTSPYEQIIHHLSSSFKTSLPYDTLKPQGLASIYKEGSYITISLYLLTKTFILKGSKV